MTSCFAYFSTPNREWPLPHICPSTFATNFNSFNSKWFTEISISLSVFIFWKWMHFELKNLFNRLQFAKKNHFSLYRPLFIRKRDLWNGYKYFSNFKGNQRIRLFWAKYFMWQTAVFRKIWFHLATRLLSRKMLLGTSLTIFRKERIKGILN